MQFQQSQVTRSTQLTLRKDGLYVNQRDGRGQVNMAVEIPYEELLPMRLEYQRVVPAKNLRWLAAGALWIIGNAARVQFENLRSLPPHFWLYALSVALGMALVVLYAWQNWWHQATLHTAHLQVTLADRPRDRRQLRAFVRSLETRTKDYLRSEYAPINPLGLIEPQLRRLAWLHELAVLETPEAQALATRLTGRLPGRGFRCLGQRMEALYVN
ncbi:hypothetical protein [Hymenobacter psoromatis]|uniref:hypothetical protein n=1 Tax=Hymenobacter psoromatis TaxID=1484116 RepID=UPI001CC026E9|nr:hypothetical protein [Hymenobacter psoromatis]